MLEDMAKEIDRLPGLLELEIAEMLRLCDAAVAALGWNGVDKDDLQSLKEFAHRPIRSMPAPAAS